MPDQPPSLNRTQALELIDSLPVPLAVTDNGLTVTFLNAAARTLLSGPVQPPIHLDEFLTTNRLVSEPLSLSGTGLQLFRIQPAPLTQTVAHALSIQSCPELAAAALETMSIAIVLLDERLRIVDLNPAAETLLGRNNLSAHKQTLNWLLPEIDVAGLLEGKASAHSQMVITPTHRLAVYRIAMGAYTALILFNLTPFQTREFERAGLLRMIVHDLLNPLNIALNFADLMDGNLLDEAERKESAQIIARQLRRMHSLLSDLALLDQTSEDYSDLLTDVHLDILAATAVSDLQGRAKQGNVNLRIIALPETGCVVHGNERLLQQALHNLIENAVKYTPPGGWVRVSLHNHPSWVDAIVADNGIGIPPSKQENLFRPFYRVKDVRMAEVEGTGLGLSLVKMVADRHEGSISLFSAPDRGTLFRLRLPQVEPGKKRVTSNGGTNHSKLT